MVNLTDLLSKHTNYWFSGLIRDKKYVPALKAWLIQVEPYQFICNDVFSYRAKDESDFEPGSDAFFQIGSCKKSKRTFFIKTLQYNQDLRRAAPFILFKKAMNQAAFRMELTDHVKRDLNINLPELNMRNISELISPMLSALEKRSDNLSAMNEYLAAIQKNNPWSSDKESYPHAEQLQIQKPSNITLRIIHIFEKLTRQHAPHEFTNIYNNSFLKSFFSPDDLRNAYNKEDRS